MGEKFSAHEYVRFHLRLDVKQQEHRFKRTSEAATALGVSAHTVRDWVYAGRIGGFYLSRRLLLIDMASVEAQLLRLNWDQW